MQTYTANPESDRLADNYPEHDTGHQRSQSPRACDTESFYTATVYPKSTDSKSGLNSLLSLLNKNIVTLRNVPLPF